MSNSECIDGRCYVPGGTFKMGSPKEDRPNHVGERPQRDVSMTSFWMGQTEVSVGEYNDYFALEVSRNFMSFNYSQIFKLSHQYIQMNSPYCGRGSGIEDYAVLNKKGEEYPVVCMTLAEKEDYCAYHGAMLLTAAQFEYGARYDIVNESNDSWDYGTTVPVKSGEPNYLGIYHLLGNVAESTRDEYDPKFYEKMSAKDPHNPIRESATEKVEIRGGSYIRDFGGSDIRPARRSYARIDSRRADVGFRCAWPEPTK